jgi:hypothetical protein
VLLQAGQCFSSPSFNYTGVKVDYVSVFLDENSALFQQGNYPDHDPVLRSFVVRVSRRGVAGQDAIRYLILMFEKKTCRSHGIERAECAEVVLPVHGGKRAP